ncbi:PLP-dependent aminotransferase family protein [Brevibacillus choshinensis]|uniref:PLP-dependent aminotransferase family protein n=1 Tax=Brevibacillus choshinensis TaxID=54911 RepID=A0ABX7FQ47_BRECH|nr:PLP-dependent aminotransferase family protein [Brevibacillus choshinensis]QRG67120.1 PLP-dependent aminotransferase family protein [Brevibacillus choshinensis]
MAWVMIDREKPVPLIRQLYTELCAIILRGDWEAGQKLPSTRKLAEELQISRNVAVEAYEQLYAEGYIESRQGSGYYVSAGIYLEQHARHIEVLSTREIPVDSASQTIDFRSGVPALEHFPRTTWGKIVQRVCQEAPLSAFGYGRPEGRFELRQVISRYLYRTRGVQCKPEQIVITSGATQALTLIAKVLLTSGSRVVIEDPITQDIQTIFKTAGAVLLPVPADEFGLVTDQLPDPHASSPSFVFVTPSHQFPLGGTLPIKRRLQLIRYARESGSYIVEDDYDSEFRYDSPPISSLQGLAEERVIYIGSFSKILSPGLRLGYLVLPLDLVERYQSAKWFSDLHTPTIEQLALAVFIEEGHLEKYINRVKKVYRKRRQTLCEALERAFSETGNIRILGASAGLHIVVSFAGIRFSPVLLNQLENTGVRVYPVEEHALSPGRHTDKLIIGYGNVSEQQIEEGVRRLYSVLSSVENAAGV